MRSTVDPGELEEVALPPEVGPCMTCANWLLYDRAAASASPESVIARHRSHPRVVAEPDGLPRLWRVVSGRSPVPRGTTLELVSSFHRSFADAVRPFDAIDWLFATRETAEPRLLWAFSSLDWPEPGPRRDGEKWRRLLYPACVEPIEEQAS